MKELYITRHGQTEWNILGKLQGSADSPLTEKGITDAKRLAARIADIPFDVVYTSDLFRAKHTADLITEGRELPRKELVELREMRMGDWEGSMLSDLSQTNPEAYENFISGSSLFQAPNGENVNEVRSRAELAVDLLKQDPADTILVVTHGMLQAQLLQVLLGIPFGEKIRVLHGTALSHFTFDGEAFQENVVGCTLHLENEDKR